MATKTDQWFSSQVADAVATRHPPGEKWVFLREVSNATGYGKSGIADALAMGCWPSIGLHLHGYEIKISRGDWLREIQDMNKSAEFARQCHFWWVAAPDGIVKLEEMPAEWGLVVVSNRGGILGARVKKAATHNQSANLSYDLFASALRKSVREDPGNVALREAVAKSHGEGWKEGMEHAKKSEARNAVNYEFMFDKLLKRVGEFEKASGISINSYRSPTQIGHAVNLILGSGLEEVERLRSIAEFCERVKSDVETLASAISKEPKVGTE